jgi:hypothetical protein
MQLDPKTAMWLNVIYACLTGVTAAGLEAAGIPHATQIIGVVAMVAMPLNIILHAFSSTQQGPLAPPPAAAAIPAGPVK